MEREEWLKSRRRGIGGSEAAKVLGLSKWGGPFAVWNEKVNGITTVEESEAMHFGTILEDVVAREFSERTGMKIRRRNNMTFDKTYPFMLANIDREIVGQRVGLECKTAGAYRASEWEDDGLPDDYYVQVQHYSYVMQWEGCWIACLIGGQKFVYKYVPRNDNFIAQMIDTERDFWENYVLTGVAPSLSIFDDVSVIDQTADDYVQPTETDLDLAKRLAAIKEQLSDLERQKEEIEVHFKSRIMENAGIDGIATWKKAKDTLKTDWKSVATELNPSLDLVRKYTTTKEGSRRFLFKVKFQEAV
jgi:putative phage-type endonuclease